MNADGCTVDRGDGNVPGPCEGVQNRNTGLFLADMTTGLPPQIPRVHNKRSRHVNGEKSDGLAHHRIV